MKINWGILIYALSIVAVVVVLGIVDAYKERKPPCPPTYNVKIALHDTLVIIKTKERVKLPDSLEEVSMNIKTGKITRVMKPRNEVTHITRSGWGTTHSGVFYNGTKDTIYEHEIEYY